MEFVSRHDPCTAPSAAVVKVQAFLAAHHLAEMADGRHDIEGEDFYVNIFGYTTAAPEARIWEAHRDYLDVHVLIQGSEVVRTAPLSQCRAGEYEADKDYLPISAATAAVTARLDAGCLAVFYPEDAHQTGLVVGGAPEAIRKAVFKLRL